MEPVRTPPSHTPAAEARAGRPGPSASGLWPVARCPKEMLRRWGVPEESFDHVPGIYVVEPLALHPPAPEAAPATAPAQQQQKQQRQHLHASTTAPGVSHDPHRYPQEQFWLEETILPAPHSSSPRMMANPTNLPTNEDADHPAGPPVYSWENEHSWWICLLCENIATRDHINSRKHRARYSQHLQYPKTLPPAHLPPGHSACAAASGSAIPLPPPPARGMGRQLPVGKPVASPPPPPPRPIDMQQDIQQSDQAVDQLITKLAVLLEQANGVLADIIHARRAERRAAIADHPPPEPQQPQDDAEQHQRDEPQMRGDAEPQDDAEPQQPQDDPTAQHQNWRRGWTETQQEYHRSYADAAQPAQRQPWRDNAQPAEQPQSWREWTNIEEWSKQ